MFFFKRLCAKALRLISRNLTIMSDYLYEKSYKLFPWTALNKIDQKLAKELPKILNQKTFFVEVGANNGIKQSNTYFLESIYGAKGLLIEASPSNYEKCLKNRSSENIFEHCALVAFDYKLPYLELIYSDLMTVTTDSTDVNSLKHATKGLKYFDGKNYNFFAPAKTLSTILKKNNIQTVDLLSLDLEGYELQALKGLDFESFLIKNIVVEARNIKDIDIYLSKYNYFLKKKLTHHDYLFCKK